MPYLVVLRRQLIEALLNYMVSVEVLNQNDDVKAESDNDGVDLGGTVGVGLTKRLVSGWKKPSENRTCLPVAKKSIIF